MQMLFCVGNADYETTKTISFLEVNIDKEYCADIVNKFTTFWKTVIFPVLKILCEMTREEGANSPTLCKV